MAASGKQMDLAIQPKVRKNLKLDLDEANKQNRSRTGNGTFESLTNKTFSRKQSLLHNDENYDLINNNFIITPNIETCLKLNK
jgi:hypothetical protein